MLNIEAKTMFKLAQCRKSQAKQINAWYWTFQSLLTDKVTVDVITYAPLPLYPDEQPVEADAWIELEKAVCVFVNQTK